MTTGPDDIGLEATEVPATPGPSLDPDGEYADAGYAEGDAGGAGDADGDGGPGNADSGD